MPLSARLLLTSLVVLAGVGVLLVLLFYVSQWAHLDTVHWLIRNTFTYAVFAAVVLFQGEIRRALAHLDVDVDNGDGGGRDSGDARGLGS